MRGRAIWFRALLLCLGAAARAAAQETAAVAGPPAPAPPSSAASANPGAAASGETTFLVQNLTRAELWRFFEPRVGGGADPDYAFIGNRSTLGARYSGRRWAVHGAIQYVRLENLPTRAIGPGLLGTGAVYFFQASGTFSYQFYLRGLSVTLKDASRGAWLELGRFSRAAALEPTSGDAVIDVLTRSHLNGRLLGDMEWSMYQRAWDGVRGGLDRGRWHTSITAALPTQGTFEESANLTVDRVHVAGAEVTADPGALVPHTSVRAFAYAYDDRRRVAGRPDNGPPTLTLPGSRRQADVRIGTAGVSAVGAFPAGSGRWDVLGWAAVQAGDWYGQSHRAFAATGQAGHQWPRAPWQPWLRAGLDYASGDSDGRDGAHGTFFPMLPSGNHLSRSSTYALMNLIDGWVEARVSPAAAVDAVAAVHQVGLARAADRWYTGSGATERTGNFFGFQGRDNAGARSLGSVVEGELTWRASRRWTLRGYAGRVMGGAVVRTLFAGDRLLTAWVESLLSF